MSSSSHNHNEIQPEKTTPSLNDGIYNPPDSSNILSSDQTLVSIDKNNNGKDTMDHLSYLSTIDSKRREQSYLKSFYQRFLVEDVVKNFTPAYFVSVMGTGISSSLLYNFPFPAYWLQICGYIMFGLTCTFFIGNIILFIMSCMYYPNRFRDYHVDPSRSVFMGAFSMGYITIVNFIALITKGEHIYFVWTLWWLAVFSAMYTSFIIVYLSFMSKLNESDADAKLNATLLLPIVAITVVSSSGHAIELDLPHVHQTVLTMIVSFMLWCLSISMAFMVMTIYMSRLIIHKIPPTNLIMTSFLPVGFLGQSSYSIYLFGNNLNKFVPEELLYGKISLCMSGFVSVFLLSFGYFMCFIAVTSVLSKIRPFAKNPNPLHTNRFGLLKLEKSFWSMTFPMGTMSLSNTEIGHGGVGNYPLLTFKVMGSIFAVACIFITVGCSIGVVVYSFNKLRQDMVNKSKYRNQSMV